MGDNRPGLSIAGGAMQRIGWHLSDPGDAGTTLDELVSAIGQIDGTKAEWREAVAFLCAQLHTANRAGDAAISRDAQTALSQIRAQIAWFDGLHGGRS